MNFGHIDDYGRCDKLIIHLQNILMSLILHFNDYENILIIVEMPCITHFGMRRVDKNFLLTSPTTLSGNIIGFFTTSGIVVT
jgi:hypothetical protein